MPLVQDQRLLLSLFDYCYLLQEYTRTILCSIIYIIISLMLSPEKTPPCRKGHSVPPPASSSSEFLPLLQICSQIGSIRHWLNPWNLESHTLQCLMLRSHASLGNYFYISLSKYTTCIILISCSHFITAFNQCKETKPFNSLSSHEILIEPLWGNEYFKHLCFFVFVYLQAKASRYGSA